MTRVALIAAFGAGGALARHGVLVLVGERSFPWATLAVNVTGSFALGLLAAWGATKLSPAVAAGLGVGFLGAFTTYSTFAVETKELADESRVPVAAFYVGASVALGVAAAVIGVTLGRAILHRG